LAFDVKISPDLFDIFKDLMKKFYSLQFCSLVCQVASARR